MSKTNAHNFIAGYVYGTKSAEDQLKLTSSDEELINLIVKMAEKESWPTGTFNNEDVKEAFDDHARNNEDRPEELQKKFNPPNYQTVIKLFRNGDIGGSAVAW